LGVEGATLETEKFLETMRFQDGEK
jgi:hypothetical protein